MARKIMLDPGHNKAKYNQGAVAGYWEGAQMWRLYEFLRPALEKRGFIVGGTKSQCDQAITVTQRGAKASGYDALISLHSNACNDPKVDRPDGIYFVDDDCGKIDGVSKILAQRLSKVVAEVMGTSNAHQYSKLSANDRDHDGKRNDDYYGVLYAAHQKKVPAIILEISFHTNVRAAKWLLQDSNLKKLADALADDLANYYGMEKPANSSAGGSSSGSDAKKKTATDHAQSGPVSSLAGTYTVTASALNVRNGAGTGEDIMVSVPKGTKVACYGYYTAHNGVKWLYVQFTYEGVTYTGFASSKYLRKV